MKTSVKQTNKQQNNMRKHCAFLMLLVTACAMITVAKPQKAEACDSCYAMAVSSDSKVWHDAEENFDFSVDREFKKMQRFIIHNMWEQSILPAMMLATEQFTALAMQQAMAIGMFIDAESQIKAQRLLQEMRAQAYKDYHPSVGLCEFGSAMKSLAASEYKGETTALILSKYAQDRQLGTRSSAAAYGFGFEQTPRILQFKNQYCNPYDRKNALSSLCTISNEEDVNRDIDFTSLIDSNWNLKINFTNQDLSADPDEEDIMALSGNLFAHNTFTRIAPRLLTNQPSKAPTEMQKRYMDMRALIAKRNVAQNSLHAIAAMKSEGHNTESGSKQYMTHILKELGLPEAQTTTLLGEKPSYYAQMEMLTKKLYQNPDFYTNLYDTPANVARKTTALQAIKLMQKFDVLKSSLRNEVSSSILLETALTNLQKEIENETRSTGGGK